MNTTACPYAVPAAPAAPAAPGRSERAAGRLLPCSSEPRAFPFYRSLHSRGPVRLAPTPAGFPGWLVLRHDVARQWLNDRRLVNDARSVLPSHHGMPHMRYATDFLTVLPSPLSRDHTEHRRLRAIFTQQLHKAAVRRRAPLVHRTVAEALEALTRRREADLVTDYILPIATNVAGDLIGIPPRRRVDAAGLVRVLSSTDHPQAPHMLDAAARLSAHIRAALAEAEHDPADNIATSALRAYRSGAVPDRQDLVGMLISAMFAALDSTIASASSGSLHLLRNPQARHRLVGDAAGSRRVLEEVLRLSAPFSGSNYRFATEPLRIAGCDVARGDVVVFSFKAANLDPRTWPNPEQLDLARDAPAGHLTFGHGPHYCAGAALGRLVLEATLTELFRRLPDLRLAADGSALPYRVAVARHPESLPVLTGTR
ncbi:cytochrome P450 [Streptomyces sp. XD-27]|uniref:cytochrome P450 n=1 Tax=Streptomyces sp. XD-27 TaxID=3062779 RepID=UPI0026F41388|nr:cytochrome P450 [Streptomyces sp. XD-27]WKX68693.1 cytochrome P450 [Streptomyces sp. XD-27]